MNLDQTILDVVVGVKEEGARQEVDAFFQGVHSLDHASVGALGMIGNYIDSWYLRTHQFS